MQYLLLIVILAGLAYTTWRLVRAMADRPKSRTIGPDDDPEFLLYLDQVIRDIREAGNEA